ncbi:ComEC/Rec2 family competence protein [Jejudonia soesokkakensis]|uniref:ComEC/Rec2 family competence protein n=1 Tax=Jejudonia soesokkakensis TaxID=1323432 RepID=A0ABW2MQJ9_9FLAO
MKFINFTMVSFAICFALGIVTAHVFPSSLSLVLYIFLSLFCLLFFFWRLNRNQLFPSVFFGILTYCSMILLGYGNYIIRLPASQPNHFTTILSENSPQILQLKITEILKPDRFTNKYITEVEAVHSESSSGNLLLNIQKDSLSEKISIDNVLLIAEAPQIIPKPLNPNQFDYSRYMKTLEVYHQIRTKSAYIIHKTKGSPSLRGRAERAREYILQKLKKTPLTLDERAILQALVLGQRRDINSDLYADYAAAGAIHILAVSGLHVGILYFILLFLLKPFHYVKNGKIIQSVLIVLLLWIFAFVTGLSPSVTRAVTMFSLFALANTLQRETSSINTLFISFFILLLYNPNWLFHVGFQLSYLAVFSILWIQPKLNSYWSPKNYFLRLFWGIFTVTLAAQLGILPLSLYYFHQFPGLFFITNLVVLPVLGILLGGGLLVVILAAFAVLPDWLARSFNWCISQLNTFIRWVAHQDSYLFTDIPFSGYKVLASYVVLVTIVVFWKHASFRRGTFIFASFILLLGVILYDISESASEELVIFQKSRQTLIGHKNNHLLTLFISDTNTFRSDTYPISSYATSEAIKRITTQQFPNVLMFRNKKMLIIDSLSVYPKAESIEWLVLTQSPKIHLERVLDSLQPSYIIADGNNYTSYIKRWRETCEKRKLPFHHTGSKGAYSID